MPLNLDILGAGALAAALRNPAVSPRVTIEARSAGALVWSGHVAQVSQTGTTLRVRGYSETIAPTASADFVAIEYGSVSVRGGLSAGDFAILPATPLPGHLLEFILSVASASEPPILNDGEYAKKAKTSAEEAEDSASVALGAKQSAVAAATSAAEDATRAATAKNQAENSAAGAATAKTAAETQAARAKDYADAANGHISSMGKLLSVSTPQSLTDVERTQALTNLWPHDGSTVIDVLSYKFTLTSGNEKISYSLADGIEIYGRNTAGGNETLETKVNKSRFSLRRGDGYSVEMLPSVLTMLSDYAVVTVTSDEGVTFSDSSYIQKAYYGPDGARVVDSSGGTIDITSYGITCQQGQISVTLSGYGFELRNDNGVYHVINDHLVGFFGASGLSGPAPSASVTTLADVINLLKTLGLIQ